MNSLVVLCLLFFSIGGFAQERVNASAQESKFWIGPFAGAGGLWGKANSESSSGRGVLVGVHAKFLLSNFFYLTAISAFEQLQLSRRVDGSGSLTDPKAGDFTHTIQFLGTGFLANIDLTQVVHLEEVGTRIFLDVGVEYLRPLTAKQEDRIGVESDFKSTDTPLLAVAGISADMIVGDRNFLTGMGQIFYNVIATGGSSFYGVRLLVALSWGIL